jgi:predicted Zn finger-like uncharacterized protein
MYTVCPKCALTLVVTAADLRIAQGYVRCGRCLNVFNALARLSEERPAAAPTPASPTSAAPGPPREEPAPTDRPLEVELDGSMLSSEGAAFTLDTQSDASPAAAPGPRNPLEAEPAEAHCALEEARAPSGTAEAGDAAGYSGTPAAQPAGALETESGRLAVPQPQSAAPQSTAAAAPTTPAPQAAPQAPAPAAPAAPAPQAAPQSAPAEPIPEPSAPEPAAPSEPEFLVPPRASRAGVGWTLAAVALTLVLALQLVNQFRDRLATRPALLGPLTKLYAELGIALVPHWNVRAYYVRQLGATLTGSKPQELLVRASVKNTARAPLPMPLLRVVLQDRFGNNIAARDVPPRAYLPASASRTAFIPPGGRIDATVALVDPGPRATGFEIDACLARSGGAVACAHAP